MLFVISGPSGCGKSTLVQRVLKEGKNLEFSVSHTTREKRKGEVEGRDYYFVTSEEFEKMSVREKFVESALVHGNYYGTSKIEIDKKSLRADVLLDIDVQGALLIKDKIKKAVFVFVLPPRFQELKLRLEKRGLDSAETIKRRLEAAKREIRHYTESDYVIINDDVNQAVEEMKAVIMGTRCRVSLRQKEILPILRSFSEASR